MPSRREIRVGDRSDFPREPIEDRKGNPRFPLRAVSREIECDQGSRSGRIRRGGMEHRASLLHCNSLACAFQEETGTGGIIETITAIGVCFQQSDDDRGDDRLPSLRHAEAHDVERERRIREEWMPAENFYPPRRRGIDDPFRGLIRRRDRGIEGSQSRRIELRLRDENQCAIRACLRPIAVKPYRITASLSRYDSSIPCR